MDVERILGDEVWRLGVRESRSSARFISKEPRGGPAAGERGVEVDEGTGAGNTPPGGTTELDRSDVGVVSSAATLL